MAQRVTTANSPSISGCFSCSKSFQKIRLESKWNKTCWIVSVENRTSEKVVRFFQVGIFQMEIHVPFLETKATFDTSFRLLWPF